MLTGYRGGKIAITGWHEGSAGQLHALLMEEGYAVSCFVNDQDHPVIISNPPPRPAKKFSYPTESSYKGLPLLTVKDWAGVLLSEGITNVLIASSDPNRRHEMLSVARGQFNILGYIHPTAVILPESVIQPGVTLLAKSVVGYRAEAHVGSFVSTGAQIDHNSVVRSCAILSPGVILCGSVEVGERTFIGAGATVVNSITIGSDCVVGAGSLVRRDVLPGTCVVGVPARLLKRNGQR